MKPSQAKVCQVCPTFGCGKLFEMKEGKTEGSIEQCSSCGEKILFRGVFLAKVEDEVEELKDDKGEKK